MKSQQSVSLGKDEIQVISRLAESKGLSFSAALRMVIREWNELIGLQRFTYIAVGEKEPHDVARPDSRLSRT